MKHTKGWLLEGNLVCKFNDKGHNVFSCSVQRGCFCGDCTPATSKELKVIARLIAKSPEMYEACKQALERIKELEVDELDYEEFGIKEVLTEAIKGVE